MNKLTDKDKNFGPFTIAPWKNYFAAYLSSGGDECRKNYLLFVAFGWALRIVLPAILKPFGKYLEHPRRYGASLSNLGNGYDFFQVFFGPQTHDSSTTKGWCKHIPWKQWRCVRNSIYRPDGTHFATEKPKQFFEFMRVKDTCPSASFDFYDYDGERITATCIIEEREWRKGEGWFKWLGWFFPAKIRRSLDIKFSEEVGPQKGSYKGGTIGHGINMLPHEDAMLAFIRYCTVEHERKGRKYSLKYIGLSTQNATTPA